MTSPDIFKLVSLIEDAIYERVDIDDFEIILPEVATVLYNRYCSNACDSHINKMKYIKQANKTTIGE